MSAVRRTAGDNAMQDPRFASTVPSDESTGLLTSLEVWGALRGLETFFQLVAGEYSGQNDKRWKGDAVDNTYTAYGPGTGAGCVAGAPLRIYDRPRMPWRGTLLDTGRHVLSVSVL